MRRIAPLMVLSLLLQLAVAPRLGAMSLAYVRPEQNYDSEVLLRKFGQVPSGPVEFSGFRRDSGSSDEIPVNAYVHFAGKGEEIYQLYGHAGILLEYEGGERIFFDWGVFDSSKPGFVSDFIHGNMMYSLSVHTIDFWMSYLKSVGRSSRLYKLRMSASQRADLQNFLFFNSRPENTVYLYDFFKDNCSTRVRDVLDAVYRGALGDQFSHVEQGTYRRAIERSIRQMPVIEFIFNFGQGSGQDATISYFDAMFLPAYLEAGMRRLEIPKLERAEGCERLLSDAVSDSFSFVSKVYAPKTAGYRADALSGGIWKEMRQSAVEEMFEDDYEVVFPEYVVEGENLPPLKWQAWTVAALLIILNTLSAAFSIRTGSPLDLAGSVRGLEGSALEMAKAARALRKAALSLECILGFVFGILSLAVLYFSSFTIHTYIYFNFNLVYANPFLFVVSYHSLRALFDARREVKVFRCHIALIALCLAALILGIFVKQDNVSLIFAFLASSVSSAFAARAARAARA